MKLTASDIKHVFEVELQKCGATLQDFEIVLKGSDSLEKVGENLQKLSFTFPWSTIGAGASLAGDAAALTGAAGGLGAYFGLRANEDSTAKQLKRLREQQSYDEAARSLCDAYRQELQPGM